MGPKILKLEKQGVCLDHFSAGIGLFDLECRPPGRRELRLLK
jgi:hypothetical protein